MMEKAYLSSGTYPVSGKRSGDRRREGIPRPAETTQQETKRGAGIQEDFLGV